MDRCRRGHFQPLLLLYAYPDGKAVSTVTAPKRITMLKGYDKDDKENGQYPITYNLQWCDRHNLYLNVKKTKEIIIDFRRGDVNHIPLYIHEQAIVIEHVHEYKYLGT